MSVRSVNDATLDDGVSTRYRAELNVKLPSLDIMTLDEVKKTIDTVIAVIADPAAASAVENKTVKLVMTQMR